MSADLSPLERAAGRAGLSDCRARLVPADRRRGRWFRFLPGEILVSELILERCPPPDACALLTHAVLLRRRWAGPRRILALAIVADTVLVAVAAWLAVSARPSLGIALFVAGAAGLVGVAAGASVASARAVLLADDDTVALLGDPTPLVRGLNLMNQDEIQLGGRRWSARPDLHRRAERLARLHRLCSGPVPVERG